jgi:asparagine synthase (glutamine-hydrolysing)
MDRYVEMLDVALETALTTALAGVEDRRLALLYSAGLDSALLARVCQDAGHSPLLLCLGTEASKDRRFVERSSPYLDLPIHFLPVDEADVAAVLPAARDLLQRAGIFSDFEKLNRIHLAIGVGVYLAGRFAHRQGIDVLVSAHGADSLFAGFDRYRRVPREELAATLERDVGEALRTGLARDRAMADPFSIRLVVPFLAPGVIELGLDIPTRLKLGSRGNKLVLRELARRRGLPEFIARRPKKSMQYSTGIWPVVRDLEQSQPSHPREL